MKETPYQPTERRPIASRRWPIWQATARWLAQVGVSPNAISLAGMGSGIVAGGAFAATRVAAEWETVCWIAAALFIQMRLLANLLDGMVAIESGRASPVGELYNEVPDRVSDAAIMIGAGSAVGGDVVLGYAAACVAIFTAYVRAMGKAAGAPQDYCGPMAKPQRMALLTVLSLACAFLPAEWRTRSVNNNTYGLMTLGLIVVIVGGLVTAVRRLRHSAAFLRRGQS